MQLLYVMGAALPQPPPCKMEMQHARAGRQLHPRVTVIEKSTDAFGVSLHKRILINGKDTGESCKNDWMGGKCLRMRNLELNLFSLVKARLRVT